MSSRPMFNEFTWKVMRIAVPQLFPVTLAEAKFFLRIYNSREDNLLRNLISMASEYAQWYTETSLMRQKWQLSCYAEKGVVPNEVHLPFGPLINVISVLVVSHSGQGVLINRERYSADMLRSCVLLKSNVIGGSGLQIIYESGTDDHAVPEQIKSGILQHVSIVYSTQAPTGSHNLAPIKEIYSPFRKVKLVL